MKADSTKPITVYVGKDEKEDSESYLIGYSYNGYNSPIYGLCDSLGYWTQMRYYADESPDEKYSFSEAIERCKEINHPEDEGRWFFDAGGNGRPIYAKIEDVERVYNEFRKEFQY